MNVFTFLTVVVVVSIVAGIVNNAIKSRGGVFTAKFRELEQRMDRLEKQWSEGYGQYDGRLSNLEEVLSRDAGELEREMQRVRQR